MKVWESFESLSIGLWTNHMFLKLIHIDTETTNY